MKLKLILSIIISASFFSCNKEAFKWTSDYDISIMSFNIRYDEAADGDNQWSNRKEACLKMWRTTQPSIVGIQEGLHHQVNFLKDNLPDYDYVGVGRDDGQTAGEHAAIYYLSNDYELLESNTFWLSETPDIPSIGWDANNYRIVTWAHFKDRKHNQSIYVFNAHFDHKGKVARKESAKLLLEKIKEIAINDAPIFIIGDFNAWISNSLFKPITKEYYDARRFANFTDNKKSFNLWGKWYANWSVDYIFYKNMDALSFRTVVEDYGVPYISDHYPLITHFNYLD
jgi:endonuclease/exonuclease/phosphatase family metal-dependent hydrolase